jgi:hypothetical protein
MNNARSQVTDQTLKGVLLGAVVYGLTKANVDAEYIASVVPVVTIVLAYASTKFGDPKIASFISKVIKELPAIKEEIEETKVVKPVKKAAAKKPAAPKTPTKK